ncbi:MAG: prolyl oligopeptidase family serine peptidase [Chloroflexi bacterium]|nr:prolyl oligopeptidase family serine peptidase [Chloroflexota bacterium]MBU1748129.1 prolyl oligopeptidase family serine peptidase [Chloroflexota bacterium]MBU1878061.1 prolyl oligopeptidase family serine peptidase [Chloroflexota bacterium]
MPVSASSLLRTICLLALVVLSLTGSQCATVPATPTSSPTPTQPGDQQRGYSIKTGIIDARGNPRTIHLAYLLFLPRTYWTQPAKKWPLILFLHGSDGRGGSTLISLKSEGIPKLVEQQPNFPFIVVSPRYPEGGGDDVWWPHLADGLAALLTKITAEYAVDPDRVYLTGFSMGGYGTWSIAALYPDRFAAIAPVCGGASPDTARALCHVPVWAFHGELDSMVPLIEEQGAVDALQACGGDVQLTIYPGAGHYIWPQTYDNPALYTWFLEHAR